MAELSRTESIANRDEPIPIVRIPTQEEAIGHAASGPETTGTAASTHDKSSRREGWFEQAQKIKDRLDSFVEGTPEARQSLQDRFFATVMSQIIPDEGEEVDEMGKPKVDRRSKKYVERPNFSVGLMSNNFRRFNARIGVVFVVENRLIHLFTWKHTSATLSFLAVYSLVCLNPHLLPVVPLVGVLFTIMIPSFLARHPVSANDPMMAPPIRGPAIAPPSRIKPAPEMSKDFFRNMRDLQNSMEDFSRMHDAANDLITPYTNFSDEALSSTLFLFLSILCCIAFIASHLVPWRAVALVVGWAATSIGHPRVADLLLSARNLRQIRTQLHRGRSAVQSWMASDMVFDEAPEQRQVEMFELQKQHGPSGTWEAWMFSATPWDPMSPARLAGARPRGTQFFDEVQAPPGWAWRDKKWSLDLFSREWVESRLIAGVEIETEGERWVYDLPDETLRDIGGSPGKSARKADVPRSGWEEGTGRNLRGDWRRRRWVRMVERRMVGGGG